MKLFEIMYYQNKRKAKREHYRQLFELNEHDSRKSWDILITIIDKEKKTSQKRDFPEQTGKNLESFFLQDI